MTRFNDVLTLNSVTRGFDEEGNPTKETTPRVVYCNRFKLGAANRYAARQAGLKADVELQVRACDYEGESDATYNGEPYTIEDVSIEGEFARLTLGKRSGNGR